MYFLPLFAKIYCSKMLIKKTKDNFFTRFHRVSCAMWIKTPFPFSPFNLHHLIELYKLIMLLIFMPCLIRLPHLCKLSVFRTFVDVVWDVCVKLFPHSLHSTTSLISSHFIQNIESRGKRHNFQKWVSMMERQELIIKWCAIYTPDKRQTRASSSSQEVYN